MHEFTLVNQNRGSTLAKRVRLAGTSRERRRGLLSVCTLDDDSGLWIDPCEAIHTFGMKMPIDSVFVDKYFRVRKLRANLSPGRIAFCTMAQSVIELPAGTIRRSRTGIGDQLSFSRNA